VTAEPVKYRSWSQLEQFEQCPYRYYLARIERVWKRPAAWLPMGTAVHEAIEEWENGNRFDSVQWAQDVYTEVYLREVNQLLSETPNTTYWQWSGPYNGEADIERRLRVGREHVERYVNYYNDPKNIHVQPVVLPGGGKAIEYPFELDLEGVKVRGVIDAAVKDRAQIIVRDAKSGNKPGKVKQLKIYELASIDAFGWTVSSGDFFMTKTGKPTQPYDLTKITRAEIVRDFQHLDSEIEAQHFDPTPSVDTCGRCDVRFSCQYAE
jgi:putative RecB family exonuclease